MQFPAPVSAQWLAEFLPAKLIGNTSQFAQGINEIHRVAEGDIVFVDHPKYYETCLNSAATFIIINTEVPAPEGKTLLLTPEPFEAYQKIVNHFRPFTPSTQMISDTAAIGEGSVVMPGVFLGNHVTIGRDCIVHPGVSIYDHCVIGDRVEIHSGVVIGGDAFYYNSRKDREVCYRKMSSCGRVVVGDDVEIGAGSTIDRGVTAETVIGKGTKIDNLVHIGHDVIIGKNCLLAAQVGIAGGTVLEDNVTLWGQVGVNKTIRLEEGTVVMAASAVSHSLKKGVYFGIPAQDLATKKRELVYVKRLPEIWEKVRRGG